MLLDCYIIVVLTDAIASQNMLEVKLSVVNGLEIDI